MDDTPQVSGYRLEMLLGEGGMGRVFRGTREADGKPVALKVMHASMEEKELRRLANEALVQSRVRSEHVPGFVEFREDPRQPVLVMEYVEGRPLDEMLDRCGSMKQRGELLRRVLPGVIDGLRAMHAEGAVHRDLKPENILVRATDGAGILLDLGLAKADYTPPVTATGFVMGTPAYMAPEQIMGRKTYGPEADLYQVALILLKCVEGAPRLDFEEGVQDAMSRAREGVKNIDTRAPILSPRLRTLVRLSLDPDAFARPDPKEAFPELVAALRDWPEDFARGGVQETVKARAGTPGGFRFEVEGELGDALGVEQFQGRDLASAGGGHSKLVAAPVLILAIVIGLFWSPNDGIRELTSAEMTQELAAIEEGLRGPAGPDSRGEAMEATVDRLISLSADLEMDSLRLSPGVSGAEGSAPAIRLAGLISLADRACSGSEIVPSCDRIDRAYRSILTLLGRSAARFDGTESLPGDDLRSYLEALATTFREADARGLESEIAGLVEELDQRLGSTALVTRVALGEQRIQGADPARAASSIGAAVEIVERAAMEAPGKISLASLYWYLEGRRWTALLHARSLRPRSVISRLVSQEARVRQFGLESEVRRSAERVRILSQGMLTVLQSLSPKEAGGERSDARLSESVASTARVLFGGSDANGRCRAFAPENSPLCRRVWNEARSQLGSSHVDLDAAGLRAMLHGLSSRVVEPLEGSLVALRKSMKPGIGGLPEGLDEEGDELVRSAEAALFHAMGAAALHPRSPVAEITLARIALVLAAPEVGHFRREGYGAVLGEADVRRLFRAALVECAERIQRPMDQVDQGVFGSFLYLVRSAGELNLDERAVSEMGFSSARDKFPAESVNWWILEASRRSALGDGEELAVALSRALKILVGQIDIAARDGAEGVSTELHQFFSLRAQAMSARLSRSVQPLIEKLYQTTRVSARSPKQDPIQSWAQLEVISAIQLASDQRAFEEWQNFEGLKKSIERASSLPTVINPAVLAWAERVLDGVWPF